MARGENGHDLYATSRAYRHSRLCLRRVDRVINRLPRNWFRRAGAASQKRTRTKRWRSATAVCNCFFERRVLETDAAWSSVKGNRYGRRNPSEKVESRDGSIRRWRTLRARRSSGRCDAKNIFTKVKCKRVHFKKRPLHHEGTGVFVLSFCPNHDGGNGACPLSVRKTPFSMHYSLSNCCFFNKSRISVNSSSSFVNVGEASSSFLSRYNLFNTFTNKKIENEIMRKSTTV
jgi:hypothetical protein